MTADVGAGSRPRPHHRAKTVASRAGYRPPTDEESPSSGEDFEVNGPPKRTLEPHSTTEWTQIDPHINP
ncbi:MAG: hypothetical protein ACRDFR_06570, partial [Candidatus Limnocylindria bacterium]